VAAFSSYIFNYVGCFIIADVVAAAVNEPLLSKSQAL
jgi:hypothetical protein